MVNMNRSRKGFIDIYIKKFLFRNVFDAYVVYFLIKQIRLVVNPIKVNSFSYLFYCTTVCRASELMAVPS